MPHDAAMITLQIGDSETIVNLPDGARPAQAMRLPIGAASIAAAHFRHDPLSEADMENAIQAVEDVVMPLHWQLPPGVPLAGTDPALREIALLAGVAPAESMLLTVEGVESVFDRLAAVVTGSTAARQGIPAGPAFAATLLILREFMHHLKFDAITWTPAVR
jgi:exopolyphosphatase/pppGpp-phosphohydrolase